MKSKKILIVLLILAMSFSCVACASSSSNSISNKTESKEDAKNLDDMTKTEKVDYYITKAQDDYEAIEDDDKVINMAALYLEDIREYVEDETQFDSDSNIEDIIYKGAFLEAYGKSNLDMLSGSVEEDSEAYKIAKIIYKLGMNSVQMVKYVYREAETPEDDSTIANIKQVKKGLQDFDNI